MCVCVCVCVCTKKYAHIFTLSRGKKKRINKNVINQTTKSSRSIKFNGTINDTKTKIDIKTTCQNTEKIQTPSVDWNVQNTCSINVED